MANAINVALAIIGFASTIGNAKDFSEIDLAKINRMYGCPERISGSLPFARAQVRLFATCLISFYSRNTVPLLCRAP